MGHEIGMGTQWDSVFPRLNNRGEHSRLSDPSRAPRVPSVFALAFHPTVGSTMDEARGQAEAGARDGTLVWALEQTSGRGRLGARWASPPGNFCASLIVRPDCPIAEAAQLGFVTALGIGAAIGSLAPPLTEVTYKWPNDVLVNGRKVCGILLESRTTPNGSLDYLIIGTGVNLISHPDDTRHPATNLAAEQCGPVEPVDFVDAYTRYMLATVNRWLENGFATIRRSWLDQAAGLGQPIQVRLPGRTLSGVFRDLDEDGCLLLDIGSDAPIRVSVGDVLLQTSDPSAGAAG